MSGDNGAGASEALGRYADSLVRGEDPADIPPTLDAGTVELVRRLNDLGRVPIPAAARERIWNTFSAQLGQEDREMETMERVVITNLRPVGRPRPAMPTPRPLAKRQTRWHGRALSSLATAALIVAMLGGVLMTAGDIRLGNIQFGGILPAGLWQDVPAENTVDAGTYRGNAARTGENPGPGPSSAPEVLWSFPIGLGGYSAPVIEDGIAYVIDADGVLYAVDAATGTERWRLETTGAAPAAWGPAVAGGTVYAPMPDGVFYALDAITGEQRWTYETGDQSCAAPAVLDGVVYGAVGCTPQGGAVFALDAASGAEIWRVETDASRAATPAVAGGMLFIAAGGSNRQASSSSAVIALEAATGEQRWEFDTNGAIFSAPAIVADTVYVTSATGTYALDVATGEQRWHHEISSFSAPAVADDLVLVSSDRLVLYALDAMTGEERWQFQTMVIPAYEGEVTVAGGVAYLGNQNGAVFAIDVATGVEVWQVTLEAGIHVPPAVVDGVIYFNASQYGTGSLIALGAGPSSAQDSGATPSALSAPAGISFVASGLTNPRGFSWAPDGTLYLAQAGTGGDNALVEAEGFTALGGETSSVATVSGGCATVVSANIHSVLWKEAGWIWGAMDVEFLGDVPYVLISGSGPTWGTGNGVTGVFRINADGSLTLAADLGGWLASNPPIFSAPDYAGRDGSEFDMEPMGDAFLISVADGGHLIKAVPDGEISLYADLSEGHLVPTGIAVSADGNAYIGFETTPPYENGASKVVKIAPDGTVSDVWTGLTAVTDVEIGPDGVLYAAEMSIDNAETDPFLNSTSGRIVRQTGPDSLEAVVTDAPPPVGIGFGADGALYFDYPAFGPDAGVGIGVIARVDLAMGPVSFAGVEAPPTCA